MKNKKLDKFFEITKRKSNIKTEIFAGITTFLAMAYILIVNPNNILWSGSADPRFSSVFIATALGAAIGTIFMALIAKTPLAQAPGMGLNAMVGSIIGGVTGFAFSYGNAMAIVFLSGIVFIGLSFVPCGKDKNGKRISLREKVFDGLPKPIRDSISIGIGLFIAFVGLQNAHIIVANEHTLISLVSFKDPSAFIPGSDAYMAIVAIFGLIVIGVLSHYNVKGSIIIGILFATILSIPLGVANLDLIAGKVPGITWNFGANLKSFFDLSNPNTVFLSVFNGGFNFPKGSIPSVAMMVVAFIMVDMFDTIGTVIACCRNANLLDKEGKPINYAKIMYSDSLSTLTGSIFGSSTVTTFVESGTGVSVGGRTGLTSLTTALFFVISIFLLPLFAFIPAPAAGSALIYVGVVMMSSIRDLDFTKVKSSIPTFVTIIMMVLSYSITDGIGLGIITFVILDIIIFMIDTFNYQKGKPEPKLESNIITIIVFILFLIHFLLPLGF